MPMDVEESYRRYAPMVLRRCRRLLGDEQEAHDAMQDVFVQALRHQERLTATAPSSLLYRIATNVCLNKLRHRKRHPADPGDELLGRIAAAADVDKRTESRHLLAALFGGEKESSQTIAVMHLLDGMTLEEVAREVGMSVSGVRKRLRRLQTALGELGGP
ncbi:MAG: sigma-70 family RNA polymerase sigma factor [Deltaproteobacteria bacterium]|nr:sigma-70 family RNA polymerase sigma factor [Deltaproteobacteria bacterium]